MDSVVSIVRNDFYGETSAPSYINGFVTTTGSYEQTAFAFDDNTANFTTHPGGRCSRVLLFTTLMHGIAFSYSRNKAVAYGVGTQGHVGADYSDYTNAVVVPAPIDYSVFPEEALRSAFGKGYVSMLDNTFSGFEAVIRAITVRAIDIDIRNNEMTAPGVKEPLVIRLRTGLNMPARCRIANYRMTAQNNYASIIVINRAIAALSSFEFSSNTIRAPLAIGNPNAPVTLGTTTDPCTVEAASVKITVENNIIENTAANTNSDDANRPALLSTRYASAASDPDWAGVSVCGNTFDGECIRTDAQIAAVVDDGGKDPAVAMTIASAAAACGIVVRENGALPCGGGGAQQWTHAAALALLGAAPCRRVVCVIKQKKKISD